MHTHIRIQQQIFITVSTTTAAKSIDVYCLMQILDGKINKIHDKIKKKDITAMTLTLTAAWIINLLTIMPLVLTLVI